MIHVQERTPTADEQLYFLVLFSLVILVRPLFYISSYWLDRSMLIGICHANQRPV